MKIRDRIKGLRRVKAGLLQPHPRNWRTHPHAQRDALRGVLTEIGYADALVAREMADGSLQLIDGHLRAEATPELEVPVLIVDIDDAEANKLLAVMDPLAGMAGRDSEVLAGLIEQVETENAALDELLQTMLHEPPSLEADGVDKNVSPTDRPPEIEIHEAFQVVVDCAGESEQRSVYERLTGEGLKCRLLNL